MVRDPIQEPVQVELEGVHSAVGDVPDVRWQGVEEGGARDLEGGGPKSPELAPVPSNCSRYPTESPS